MKVPLVFVSIGFLVSCGQPNGANQKTSDPKYEFNYVALTTEYLDSIGFSFYDKKQVLYMGDSTFIVYPDSNDLVFYHLESKQEVSRLTFSFFVENCTNFSAEAQNDAAVWYGDAVVVKKDGLEEFHELGEGFDGFFWYPFYGFEYFSDLNKVVLGAICGKWPGTNDLDRCLAGLSEYDLEKKEIRQLPFAYSEIYRDSLFWGAELYITKSTHKLVISENWSENVYIIDMTDYSMNTYRVKHSTENLKAELPKDLGLYPQLIPEAAEQKTVKYALWELRHFYFEKYGQAFLSGDGQTIYRTYYHRIPLGFSNTSMHGHFKNLKGLSILKNEIGHSETKEFMLLADHFALINGFWLSPKKQLNYIKFLYRRDRDVDNAVYLFERIEPLSI